MPTVDVVTAKNEGAGSLELSDVVFGAEVKPHLFHAEVRRQLAARRSGTHSSKNRAAVSGGGSKPYRQKGTGRARQGTTRAPQFAGGGSVFGPVPRSHSHSLNKKFRRAALRSALSHQVESNGVKVVEEIELGEYKTKKVCELLDQLELAGLRVLIVIAEANPYIEGSAKNLENVSVIRVAGLNVFDVLRHERLLVTRNAVAAIETRLGDSGSSSEETSGVKQDTEN
ncbi:50S ribosomal protein L4 [Myxococcota bacterium]|nr:50S ribosomal protein L4 [Myxococcota bacterium]